MGKLILFIFAVIASAAAGTSYFFKVEAQRAQLKVAEEKLAEIKSAAARKAVVMIPTKQENRDLQARIDALTKVTSENERLAGQIPVLETTLADLTREFVEAVSKVRAASTGVALPNLTLSSGQVLQGVRIIKITDSEVTLAHSGGSARVPGSSLPADLRDRLRIDMRPMVDTPTAVAASSTAPQASPAPSTGADSVPSGPAPVVASTETASAQGSEVILPAAPELTQSQRNRIGEAEVSLSEHEKKEMELRRTRGAYLAQLQDYQKKDDHAKFMGEPMKYQKVIPQIIKAITEIDNQLTETTSKIITLKVEVDQIKEGRVQ